MPDLKMLNPTKYLYKLTLIKCSYAFVYLFARGKSAAFRTFVAAVFVKRYFYFGFGEFTLVWQTELHIPYVQSALHPHSLVICLYGENPACCFVYALGVIEVFGAEE